MRGSFDVGAYSLEQLWSSEEITKLIIFFLSGHFVVGSERMTEVNDCDATAAHKDVFRTDVPMKNAGVVNGV